MDKFKALYLEDDPSMQSLVMKILPENIEVSQAHNMSGALDLLNRNTFHIILVDLRLEGESGFEFLESLKDREFPFIPSIIIITASENEADEVRSHKLNVFEFIRKPLRPEAFKSQMEKYINRFRTGHNHVVKRVGPFVIDESKMEVKLTFDHTEEPILLTLKEYKLLLKLVNNPKKTYTREELLKEVWNISSDVQSRTIDMHISSLRKKLGAVGDTISSIRGVGYSFNLDKIS
ncbi:response regulator transcription factor [Peredibacter starrii]|uniref:Response regulator transcription factor n=1 Tax=Peredibacter starrii TaxID=28202 RepID=A0AAX4HMA2_9BACT|nr:response regulator transcription factor [Peredibacter starrii]WPU64320.1 response regulator transcription factor [Peredibacter starrii]